MTPSVSSIEEINRTLGWIALQPDKSKVKHDFRYGSGISSQWNKVDSFSRTVFEIRPVLVSPPFTVISLVRWVGLPLGD